MNTSSNKRMTPAGKPAAASPLVRVAASIQQAIQQLQAVQQQACAHHHHHMHHYIRGATTPCHDG